MKNLQIKRKVTVDAITAEYYRDQKINDRWVFGISIVAISCTIVCFFLTFEGILF